MSNLATMVMEGTSLGWGSARLDHHYDHENGAGLIAMESAEALHSIFEDTFYVPNTCTIKAAMEGVSVEESSMASVMEASIKGVFAKIKEFFIKLKDKVKDFLHNIKRYLTGIFGDDEKWVKTYESELKSLDKSALNGYEVKMYTYTIDSAWTKDEISQNFDATIKLANDYISSQKSASHGLKESDVNEDALKEDLDQIYRGYISDLAGKSIDEDEMDKAFWSVVRNGADSETDKDDVKVASIMQTAIDALKNSKKVLAAYDTMISKVDANYNKTIKYVSDVEKKFGNLPSDSNGVKKEGENVYGVGAQAHINAALRALSSTLSKIQSAENKRTNAAKAAVVERNGVYKKALVGAFSYAKKHKGGK